MVNSKDAVFDIVLESCGPENSNENPSVRWGLEIAKRAIATVASVDLIVELMCSCCSLWFNNPSEPIIILYNKCIAVTTCVLYS